MEEIKEIWKDIDGYDSAYQVSNLGRIKSIERIVKDSIGRTRKLKEKYIKTHLFGEYLGVNLRINNEYKQISIHRAIATAFIPNLENKPEVNHIDGNKLNNSIDNLEWVTYSENIIHAYKSGLRSKKHAENLWKYRKNTYVHTQKVVVAYENGVEIKKSNTKDMAIFIKEYKNIKSNVKNIAKNIRMVCLCYEYRKNNKITNTKNRNEAYGMKFKYEIQLKEGD
jgi:hypothetical protein